MQVTHLIDASKTLPPTVVLNDISGARVSLSASPKKDKSTRPHVISTLETLIADRKAWEENVYKKSNEQLYELLQRCYLYYHSLCGLLQKDAHEQFLNYFVANGFSANNTTHLITKVVRVVFNDKSMDRRRVSTYSLVLRAAHKQVMDGKIKKDAIAKYISLQGGVEQIRLAKSPTALTPKQKACEAAKMQALDLAVVESEQLSQSIVVTKNDTYAVLLAMQNADGTFAVRSVIYNDGVVNSALAAFYGKQKSLNDAAKEQGKVSDSEQQKDRAIKAALSEIADTSI